MISRFLRKAATAIVLTALLAPAMSAQERNDVIKAYNEGAKAIQTDPPTAIKSFETAIALADKVGESAADLKQKSCAVLPSLYQKVASAAINEKKPVPEVMKAAKSASAVSEKYGTAAQKETASKLLVQAYNVQGVDYFSKNDYKNAVLTFDSLLAINPEYVNAIYNKALIYIRQTDYDSFEKTIDTYIEKVKAAADEPKTKQASTLALEYFRGAGSKALQAGKTEDALAYLNKAAKYGDDKDLFYYYADAYNRMKNFDKGMEYAKRGLDLETGGPEAKAKFYFQLGESQAGKNLTAEACASYKNSAYGPFAEAAKAQLKNLKCQ
jgi:tetratricopeptide (TPR) repeat protein